MYFYMKGDTHSCKLTHLIVTNTDKYWAKIFLTARVIWFLKPNLYNQLFSVVCLLSEF